VNGCRQMGMVSGGGNAQLEYVRRKRIKSSQEEGKGGKVSEGYLI